MSNYLAILFFFIAYAAVGFIFYVKNVSIPIGLIPAIILAFFIMFLFGLMSFSFGLHYFFKSQNSVSMMYLVFLSFSLVPAVYGAVFIIANLKDLW